MNLLPLMACVMSGVFVVSLAKQFIEVSTQILCFMPSVSDILDF